MPKKIIKFRVKPIIKNISRDEYESAIRSIEETIKPEIQNALKEVDKIGRAAKKAFG